MKGSLQTSHDPRQVPCGPESGRPGTDGCLPSFACLCRVIMLKASLIFVALGMAVVACGGTSSDGQRDSGAAGDSGGGTGGIDSGGGAGGSSTGGAPSDDVPLCDSLPQSGALCSSDGSRCQVAGSPCGSIFTCTGGRWQTEVVCPPGDDCPPEPPSADVPCTLQNPASGELVCTYRNCGHAQATCDGATWTIQRTPESAVCRSYCSDACMRLLECGIGGADTCVDACHDVYACPGETVGQDDAICESRAMAAEGLSCSELCAAVTSGDGWPAFGGDCEGI